jgi:acyl-CoA thioester hydrolase
MTETNSPHRFPVSVYWEDTDAAGIVYYANYLKFMERARSDLVAAAGVDQAKLLDEDGLVFPVRRCEIDYLLPARLQDDLEVITRITKVGGASIDMRQDVMRGSVALTQARIRLACVDRDGRPRRLPPQVRHILAAQMDNETEGSA